MASEKAGTSSSSINKTPKKLIMDDSVSTLVTSKTTVIPRSSRSTSRLSSILERLSDDRPLSSSTSNGGTTNNGKESGNSAVKSSRPPSKASLIIQASRKRDTDCQTVVSIEQNLDIEFITRGEISAIQRDRDELESLLQQSLNSALKMKEKHDTVVQENNELKEALDILQTENQSLKDQVDELKDMMRELRRLQKEEALEASTHRTFGGSRSKRRSSNSSSNNHSGSLRLSDLSPGYPHRIHENASDDSGSDLEDPHFDDEIEQQHLEKLATMFQKLNDSCDITAGGAKLIDSNEALLKSLQSMKQRSREMVDSDRECRSQESKMVQDIRTLAEQAVALLVETEAAQTALKEAYGSHVEFAPKQEVDPYKINVKVAEREKRRRRPGQNSNSSSSNNSDDQVDFLFGSPSHRYPVSPARGRSSADEEGTNNGEDHRLDEHPEEDDDDSSDQHRQNRQIDAIAEEEEEEDDEEEDENDSLNNGQGENRQDAEVEEDDEVEEQRHRRKLRFEDEQDREALEEIEESENTVEKQGARRDQDEEEEDEVMTEEEYLFYLQLEQEQEAEKERERERRHRQQLEEKEE